MASEYEPTFAKMPGACKPLVSPLRSPWTYDIHRFWDVIARADGAGQASYGTGHVDCALLQSTLQRGPVNAVDCLSEFMYAITSTHLSVDGIWAVPRCEGEIGRVFISREFLRSWTFYTRAAQPSSRGNLRYHTSKLDDDAWEMLLSMTGWMRRGGRTVHGVQYEGGPGCVYYKGYYYSFYAILLPRVALQSTYGFTTRGILRAVVGGIAPRDAGRNPVTAFVDLLVDLNRRRARDDDALSVAEDASPLTSTWRWRHCTWLGASPPVAFPLTADAVAVVQMIHFGLLRGNFPRSSWAIDAVAALGQTTLGLLGSTPGTRP
jgi:hypothetical protein